MTKQHDEKIIVLPSFLRWSEVGNAFYGKVLFNLMNENRSEEGIMGGNVSIMPV